MSKYYVDQEECIGCGLCAEIAPDVFIMEGEKAVAIEENGKNSEEAFDNCPVNAIKNN